MLLALVGIAVERRHTRAEWIVLYLTAGIVGELVGLDWQPHGAGNSVAILGLAGALVVDALRRRDPALVPLGYTTVVLMTLMADDVGGHRRRRDRRGRVHRRGRVVRRDSGRAHAFRDGVHRHSEPSPFSSRPCWFAIGNIHGPALLTGVAVALVWNEVGATARAGARTGPSPRPG